MTLPAQAADIGRRFKSERARVGLTQTALAKAIGVGRRTICAWEAGEAFPLIDRLATFGEVGADVLFIVVGRRDGSPPPLAQSLPGVTVRQALAMLDTADRRRLLLDLLATELSDGEVTPCVPGHADSLSRQRFDFSDPEASRPVRASIA